MAFDSIAQNIVLFLGMLAALPLLMGLGRLVGWVLRIRSQWFPVAFFLAVVVAVVAVGSLYLDGAGTVTTGTIIQRQEVVPVRGGTWNRFLTVFVKYQPQGAPAPVTTDLNTDTTRFDRLHVGDRVPIRYVRLFGFLELNRFADENTFTALVLPHLTLLLWAMAAVAVAFAAGIVFRAPGLVQGMLALAVIGVGLFMDNVVFASLREARFDALPKHTVTARVHYVTEVRETSSRRRRTTLALIQPYAVVTLDLTPPKGGQPVVAVDVVDLGSVAVTPGQAVTVTVLDTDPRQAHLPGGTRTYIWKNAIEIVAAILCVGFIIVIGWRKKRQMKARAASARVASPPTFADWKG